MALTPYNNQTPTTSGAKTTHKSVREKERRDEINTKISELRLLICEDEYERKSMKQADVLHRTVELVYQMENETPGPSTTPDRKGFVDGFAFVEKATASFIKNLGVDATICQDFLDRMKLWFNADRNRLMITTKHAPPGALRSTKSSPESLGADRREIKKNREQDRRDRQGEAIELLKNFLITISANQLVAKQQVEKMQRLNTLENIIEYIKNKKNKFVGSNPQEQMLYDKSYDGGFDIAKKTAMSFFRSDRHLSLRLAALDQTLSAANIRPKPVAPLVLPPILPNFMPFLPLYPTFQFQVLPPPPMPPIRHSPTYSLSPPPSSSSSETTSSNSSPPEKLWRPWQ